MADMQNKVTWMMEMIMDDRASVNMAAVAKSMTAMAGGLRSLGDAQSKIKGIEGTMTRFANAAENVSRRLSASPLFSATGVTNLANLGNMARMLLTAASAFERLAKVDVGMIPRLETALARLATTMAPYATMGPQAASGLGQMARQINNLALSFRNLARVAPNAKTAIPMMQQVANVMGSMPQGANIRVTAGGVNAATGGGKAAVTQGPPLTWFQQAGVDFGKSMETLKNAAGKLGTYYGSFLLLSQAHKTLLGTLQELGNAEEQFIDIRKYLPMTESIGMLRGSLYDLSKTYGQTSSQILEAYVTFAQQGLKVNEILAVTKSALLASNIAATSFKDSVSAITAVTRVYNMDLNQSSTIVDKLAIVQARSAVSAKELIEAFLKAGAVAQATGSSFEFFNGLVAAAAEKTRQSGDIIGNALKTILERVQRLSSMQKLKSIAPLSDINFTDQAGNISSSEYLLTEIAKRWENLTDVQRKQVGETIAAGRQINIFLGIMNNWKTVSTQMINQHNSLGFAERANMTEMSKLSRQWEVFKQTGLEMASAVSQYIYPALTSVTKSFNEGGAAAYAMAAAVATLAAGIGAMAVGALSWLKPIIMGLSATQVGVAAVFAIVTGLISVWAKNRAEMQKSTAENDAFAKSMSDVNKELNKFKTIQEKTANLPNALSGLSDKDLNTLILEKGLQVDIENGQIKIAQTEKNLKMLQKQGILPEAGGPPIDDIVKGFKTFIPESGRLENRKVREMQSQFEDMASIRSISENERARYAKRKPYSTPEGNTTLAADWGIDSERYLELTRLFEKEKEIKEGPLSVFLKQDAAQFAVLAGKVKDDAVGLIKNIIGVMSDIKPKQAGPLTESISNTIELTMARIQENAEKGGLNTRASGSFMGESLSTYMSIQENMDKINALLVKQNDEYDRAGRTGRVEEQMKLADAIADTKKELSDINLAYYAYSAGMVDASGKTLVTKEKLTEFYNTLQLIPNSINLFTSAINSLITSLSNLTGQNWIINIGAQFMGLGKGAGILDTALTYLMGTKKTVSAQPNIKEKIQEIIDIGVPKAKEAQKTMESFDALQKKQGGTLTNPQIEEKAKARVVYEGVMSALEKAGGANSESNSEARELALYGKSLIEYSKTKASGGGGAARKAERMEGLDAQARINAEQAKYNVLKEQQVYLEKEVNKYLSSQEMKSIRKTADYQREMEMYARYAGDKGLSDENRKKYQGMSDTARIKMEEEKAATPGWIKVDIQENLERQQTAAKKATENRFAFQQKLESTRRGGSVNDPSDDVKFQLRQQKELIAFKEREYAIKVQEIKAGLEAKMLAVDTDEAAKQGIARAIEKLETTNTDLLQMKEVVESEKERLQLIQAQGEAAQRLAAINKVSGILNELFNPITLMKERDEKNKKRDEINAQLTKLQGDASMASGDVAGAEQTGNIDKINAARDKYRQVNDQIKQTKESLDKVNESTNKWKKVLEDIGNTVIKKIFDKIAGALVDGGLSGLFGAGGGSGIFGSLFGGGGSKSTNSMSLAGAVPALGGLFSGGKSMFSAAGNSSVGSFIGAGGSTVFNVVNAASGGSMGSIGSSLMSAFGGGGGADAGSWFTKGGANSLSSAAESGSGGLFGGGGGIMGTLTGGLVGYGVGKATKSKGAGALAGGLTGFMSGGIPGAIIGVLGGLFGGGGDDEAPPPPPQREFYPVTKNTEALDRNTLALMKISEGVFNAPTAFEMPKAQATANASAVQIGTLTIQVGSGANSSQVARSISDGVAEYQRNLATFTTPSKNVG